MYDRKIHRNRRHISIISVTDIRFYIKKKLVAYEENCLETDITRQHVQRSWPHLYVPFVVSQVLGFFLQL